MPIDQYGRYYPDQPYNDQLAGARMLYNAPLFGAPQTPAWSFSSAVLGNAFGTRPDLPMGQSRTEFEREREMVSGQYMSGIGWGAAAVGTSIAASYAMFGSPLQDLGQKMFGQAFDVTNKNFIPQGIGQRSLHGLASATQGATNLLNAGLWKAGGVLGRGAGTAVGAAFGGAANLGIQAGAAVTSRALNAVTMGASDVIGGHLNTLGTSAHTFGGELMAASSAAEKSLLGEVTSAVTKTGASAFDRSAVQAATKAAFTEATASGLGMAEASAAAKAAAKEAIMKQSTWGQYGRGMASGARAMGGQALAWGGSVLRAGSIGEAAGIVGRGMMTAGGAVGGAMGAMVLPALVYGEAIGRVAEYGSNMYENFKTSSQLERDMFEKSNRILRYGGADDEMGLGGGFTAGQRNKFQSAVKAMAITAGSKSDLFGGGQWSPFGGQSGYTEKMKELKAIFNVGTDMGMFDTTRSFDDFQKKFSDMVAVVDKLSKLIKTSKGKVMEMLGTMRNEGFVDINEAGKNLAFRQYVAQVTGKDMGVVMNASSGMSRAYMQAGLDPNVGSTEMSNAMLMINRSRRTGVTTDKDVVMAGGEEALAAEIATTKLRIMQHPSARVEMMRAMEYSNGKMVFNRKILRENLARGTINEISAGNEGATRQDRMNREAQYTNEKTLRTEAGGWLNAREADFDAMLARGELNDVLEETMLGLEKQNLIGQGRAGIPESEARLNMFRNLGFSDTAARLMVAERSGAFAGEVRKDAAANITKAMQDQEKNFGVNTWTKKAAAGVANVLGAVSAWYSGDGIIRPTERAAAWYGKLMGTSDTMEETKLGFIKYQEGQLYSGEKYAKVANLDTMSFRRLLTEGGQPFGGGAKLSKIEAIQRDMEKGLAIGNTEVSAELEATKALTYGGRKAQGRTGWMPWSEDIRKTISPYLYWEEGAGENATADMKKRMEATKDLRDRLKLADPDRDNKAITIRPEEVIGAMTISKAIYGDLLASGLTPAEAKAKHEKFLRNLNVETRSAAVKLREVVGAGAFGAMTLVKAVTGDLLTDGMTPDEAKVKAGKWFGDVTGTGAEKPETVNIQGMIEAGAFGAEAARDKYRAENAEEINDRARSFQRTVALLGGIPIEDLGSVEEFKKRLYGMDRPTLDIFSTVFSTKGYVAAVKGGLGAKLTVGKETRTLEEWAKELGKRDPNLEKATLGLGRADNIERIKGALSGRERVVGVGRNLTRTRDEFLLVGLSFAQGDVRGEAITAYQEYVSNALKAAVDPILASNKQLTDKQLDFFRPLTLGGQYVGKELITKMVAGNVDLEGVKGAEILREAMRDIKDVTSKKTVGETAYAQYLNTPEAVSDFVKRTLTLEDVKKSKSLTDKEKSSIEQATTLDVIPAEILKKVAWGSSVNDKNIEEIQRGIAAGKIQDFAGKDIKAEIEAKEKGLPTGEKAGELPGSVADKLLLATTVLEKLMKALTIIT